MFTDEDKQLIAEFALEKFEEPIQIDLLAQYYETRDIRVSLVLEEQLSDEQLDAFEKLHDAGDDNAVAEWLRSELPDYDKLVQDETARVKADIKQSMATMHDDL